MATCSAESLLGVLVLVPDSVKATTELCERSDAHIGIATLLDLGGHRWGQWAAERARPESWLAWSRDIPVEFVLALATKSALTRDDEAAIWVGELLRRMAWISDCTTSDARALHKRGTAAPGHTVWVGGLGIVVDCWTVPSLIVTSLADECGAQCHPWRRHMQGLALQNPLLRACFDLAPIIARSFPSLFTKDLAEYAGMEEVAIALEELEFSIRELMKNAYTWDKMRSSQVTRRPLENVPKFSRGAKTPSRRSPNDSAVDDVESLFGASECPIYDFSFAYQIAIAMLSDFYIGKHLTASHHTQSESHIISARVGHREIYALFDGFVGRAGPLTPQQHAVFIALGLAQYQTTWSWPLGQHWHSWFTSPPPEHWLAAYVWHLCWMVGEPQNPDHQARAVACLNRSDWPELAAVLRGYQVGVPSDEVLALFD